MARTRDADGGDGPQIRSVAAVPDSRQWLVLQLGGLDGRLTHRRETRLLRNVTQGPGIGQVLWSDRQRQSDARIGIWNVRNLYSAGSLKTVVSETARDQMC
jgi:hypothetical protein